MCSGIREARRAVDDVCAPRYRSRMATDVVAEVLQLREGLEALRRKDAQRQVFGASFHQYRLATAGEGV